MGDTSNLKYTVCTQEVNATSAEHLQISEHKMCSCWMIFIEILSSEQTVPTFSQPAIVSSKEEAVLGVDRSGCYAD